MYTICPSCLRRFRLRAQQLAAAGGKVRCGYCQVVFNALEHLRDTDGPEPPVLSPPPTSGRPRPEAAATDSSVSPGEGLGPEWEPEPYLLDVLAGTPPPTQTHPLWRITAGGLVALLCLQLTWNFRDELQAYYQPLQSGFRQLCDDNRCLPRRRGSLAGLTILDQDIRFHPDYEDAILVNAAIINNSTHAMAYPNLQLQLLNEYAEPVAYREFTPMEYLHGERQVAAGLNVGDQFHVLLELTGPVTQATSFELGYGYPSTLLSVLR